MANGYLYVIKDTQTSLTKIGITGNWKSRMKALKVGSKTECRTIVEVSDNREWEKRFHKKYNHWRLVGTEWFKLDFRLEEELIQKVNQIGRPVCSSEESANAINSQDSGCWWSTEQGREEACRLIYNIDEDEITELEVSNPWFDFCDIPREEEWTDARASVSFRFWHPKSLGGELAEVWVEPDGTCEGSYFDYEEQGDKWMIQSFKNPPKGISDVIDRLWLLCDLDKSEWPLKVFTNSDRLKRYEAELERLAGPPLPEEPTELERYLEECIERAKRSTEKAFNLAYMKQKIFEEWKQKGLNTEPDNPPTFYNAEIAAEAELRYSKGFRVSTSDWGWRKVAPDGKWIDCEEHETSI